MVKKKIGCSLPFIYLSGEKNTEFESIFGPLDDFLHRFKSKGVESIELRAVSAATSPDALAYALNKIGEHGLSVTIHGSLPDLNNPEANFLAESAMTTLPTDAEMIVTFHAYAGEMETKERYAEKTVMVLKRLLKNSPSNIVFALEVNREKPPRVDPGSYYAGILEMLLEIDSPRVGACWDFGHSAANLRNGYSEMFPGDDFLKCVIHTHIHDISDEGKTHFPLTCGNLDLKGCVDRLLNAGYEGVFNFEPSVDRWSWSADEKRSAMFASIDILASSLEK